MRDPLGAERLAEIKAAYIASLHEAMVIGQNHALAWGAVPALLDEVERLKAELAEQAAAMGDLRDELDTGEEVDGRG